MEPHTQPGREEDGGAEGKGKGMRWGDGNVGDDPLEHRQKEKRCPKCSSTSMDSYTERVVR